MMIRSGSSQGELSYSCKQTPFIQEHHSDSMSTKNRTSCSTPDLPFSDSSDLLDIPFASLLDIMDFTTEGPANQTITERSVTELVNDSSVSNYQKQSYSPVIHNFSNFPNSHFYSNDNSPSSNEYSSYENSTSSNKYSSNENSPSSNKYSSNENSPSSNEYSSNENPALSSESSSASKENSSLLNEDSFNDDSFASNENVFFLNEDLSMKNDNSPTSNADGSMTESILRPYISTDAYIAPEKVISGTSSLRQHFSLHKPKFVWIPSDPKAKCNKLTLDSHNYSLNNGNHDIKDVGVEIRLRNEPENWQSYQHIAVADVNLTVPPKSAEIQTLMLPSIPVEIPLDVKTSLLTLAPTPLRSNETQSCSDFGDIVQHTHIRKQEALNISLTNHISNNDNSIRNSSYKLPETHHNAMTNQSGGTFDHNLSTRNSSWSFYNLPNNPQDISNYSFRNDNFITVRSRLLQIEMLTNSENGSASKRRKYNYKDAPLVTREKNTRLQTVNQQLLFQSPPQYRYSDSTNLFTAAPQPVYAEHTIYRANYESSPLRTHLSEKENDSRFCHHVVRAKRKPFSELSNSTTYLNSLVASSEDNTECNRTSKGMILPSRREELLSRDAYYCDFTIDRQHKIDDYILRRNNNSNMCEEQEDSYQDRIFTENFERKVEGAESPSSNFVFHVPPQSQKALRGATQVNKQKLRSKVNTLPATKHPLSWFSESDRSRITNSHSTSSDTHKCIRKKIPSSTEYFKKGSSASSNSRCQSRIGRSRKQSSSSKSQSRKSCTTHPIASSTMILDSSSCSTDTEAGNWSDNKDNSLRDFERSYFYSTKEDKKNEYGNNRPLTTVGKESSKHLSEDKQDVASFEISAMVSRMDKIMKHPELISGKQTSLNKDFIPDNYRSSSELEESKSVVMPHQHILAGAKSFMKTVDKVSKNLTTQNNKTDSSKSLKIESKQRNISSRHYNSEKASIIVYTSSENPERGHSSDERLLPKCISFSEPDLCREIYGEYDKKASSINHEDIDLTSTLMLENDKHILETSSAAVDGVFCPKVRPKKRPVHKLLENNNYTECSITPGHELLDSILTDSPKSVNSSGIFAPDNSVTIPTESVSNDGGCSTKSGASTLLNLVSSGRSTSNKVSAGTSTSNLVSTGTSTSFNLLSTCTPFSPMKMWPELNKGLITPHICEKDTIFIDKSQPIAKSWNDNKKTNPYPQASIFHSRNSHSTKSQETIASSTASIPHRTMSVKSDVVDRKSEFVATPGVITGPPKIKSKNSLLRKLRKFSNNLLKKTERIQVLAHL